MPANTYGRQVVEALTNKSGGGVVAGDVVVIDGGNDGAFTTSTAGAVTTTVGIAQETIANNATGRILTAGYAALVNVNASVTRGNYGATHTVAKQATDAGSSRVVGVFCQFLTGGASPTAHVFGITDASTGAGGAPSGSKYVVGAADATLSAEKVKAGLYDNYDLDDYPGSPNALDDEFEGSGSIDAKWTKVNDPAGGDAMDQTTFPGFLRVGLVELGTDNYDNLIRLTQTPPTGTATMEFTIKAAIAISGIAAEHGEFATVGVYLGNTTNDEAVGSCIQVNNSTSATTPLLVTGEHYAAGAAAGMTSVHLQMGYLLGQEIYLKLKKTTASAYTSANTYESWASINGRDWEQTGTMSKTFTTACDEVGIYFRRPKSQTGTPAGTSSVDFFRKTA